MSTQTPLATVPQVDIQRYMGTWYEIARLPMRHEPEDATDITATYSLKDDGKVEVHNRLRRRGEVDEAVGEATALDDSASRLEVSFLPEGLRWIPSPRRLGSRLEPDYSVALVGSPDRSPVLLARTRERAATRRAYLPSPRSHGFRLTPRIDTPQSA